ncbi:MAG: HDIG domain-containing protein [Candidatus Hydrogenedentota bacterium]|nr:MAG: HDIG domain-containing protein [Candidatus Hydrogenedentota bacterium]
MIKEKWNEFLIAAGQFLNKRRSESAIKKIILVLFSATFAVSSYLITFPYLKGPIEVKLGDKLKEDIRVLQDITYEIPEKTKELRKQAYEKERFVFYRDFSVLKQVISDIQTELRILYMNSNGNAMEQAKEKLPWLKRARRAYADKNIKECFWPRNKKRIMEWATTYAKLIFDNYGITKDDLTKLKGLKKAGALVRTINTDNYPDLVWDYQQIIPQQRMFESYYYNRLSQLGDYAFQNQLTSGARKLVVHRLLQHFYRKPYLAYNEAETKRIKQEAADNVTPVTETMHKGYIIALKGEIVDPVKLKKIEILNRYQSKLNFQFVIGILLLQGVLVLAVSFYLFYFAGVILKDVSSNVQLHSIVWSIMIYAFVVGRLLPENPSKLALGLLTPVAYASAMMTLLFSPRLALIVGIYISFFLFFLDGNSGETLILSFVGIMTGIYTGNRMEKRTQIFKGSFVTGLLLAISAIGIDLMHAHFNESTFDKIAYAFGNGIVSMILMMGILPVYEVVFNLATRFRLRELSDFHHPLLQRLALEAPSTYTHSMMMANLCERAAAAIGADALLAKVGCMYHDIGKMLNPSFYAENRHLFPKSEQFQKLGPLKSAQIILSHVIDGIRMAREFRLPEKIVDFIPEHHGTTTMRYFYHEALKQAKGKNKVVAKEAFQYPGPKPHSKETTIAMIADSVEAATRSLDNPTPENIEEIIDKVIQMKLEENQLDESPLTVADLKKVKQAFVDVLINSHHLRPKYPSQEATQKLENAVQKQTKKLSQKNSAKPRKTSTKKQTTKKKISSKKSK